eukprot:2524260-Prymnesium_polylepis.2
MLEATPCRTRMPPAAISLPPPVSLLSPAERAKGDRTTAPSAHRFQRAVEAAKPLRFQPVAIQIAIAPGPNRWQIRDIKLAAPSP